MHVSIKGYALSLGEAPFLVRGFLSGDECERLIEIARPKLRASLMMGNASAGKRTSESVFLPASEDELLRALRTRLSALTQLPAAQVAASEDLQVRIRTSSAHLLSLLLSSQVLSSQF